MVASQWRISNQPGYLGMGIGLVFGFQAVVVAAAVVLTVTPVMVLAKRGVVCLHCLSG